MRTEALAGQGGKGMGNRGTRGSMVITGETGAENKGKGGQAIREQGNRMAANKGTSRQRA